MKEKYEGGMMKDEWHFNTDLVRIFILHNS